MRLTNAQHYRWLISGRLPKPVTAESLDPQPTATGRDRRWRNRGITEAAKTLGVSRNHLWLVVTGRRKSAPLLKRYNELLKQGRVA